MNLDTQCPKCGSTKLKDTGAIETDSEFSCADCDHTAKITEFISPESSERLEQMIQDEFRKAFSGIPGITFK